MIKSYILYISLSLLILGCGGGGGGGTEKPPQDNPPKYKDAQLLDSPVSGIYYSCNNSDSNGTTNENGTFRYDDSCGDISFSLGGVNLYSINATNIPSD